ncbi:uncharacterized protein PAN0_011c4232 [Moesziomyces antarcticus]|uniref:Uncharacterized protein n=2 Tax=Pseudozyma antarctica TaxID=84753 RepID=A0A081CH64_PSEA2|nr:uncharacterized protein PAN0_011c4232 [Moesziomyces antarcticus]GAK66010.1 hypothetical protein PAN0_011c4232 [Moesziomyces antarcticus]SPO46785.1 uncharacterized protein PSANT_04471 [Moesziomyces antarcticus]
MLDATLMHFANRALLAATCGDELGLERKPPVPGPGSGWQDDGNARQKKRLNGRVWQSGVGWRRRWNAKTPPHPFDLRPHAAHSPKPAPTAHDASADPTCSFHPRLIRTSIPSLDRWLTVPKLHPLANLVRRHNGRFRSCLVAPSNSARSSIASIAAILRIDPINVMSLPLPQLCRYRTPAFALLRFVSALLPLPLIPPESPYRHPSTGKLGVLVEQLFFEIRIWTCAVAYPPSRFLAAYHSGPSPEALPRASRLRLTPTPICRAAFRLAGGAPTLRIEIDIGNLKAPICCALL